MASRDLGKNYSDNIFVDTEINQQGQGILNCKPGFTDTRTFIVTTNLKENCNLNKKIWRILSA